MTEPDPGLVDALVAPLLLELRDCAVKQLGLSIAGPVCRAFLAWGGAPPVMDGCHCGCQVSPGVTGNGDAWVRLSNLGPDPAMVPRGVAAGCPTGYVATIGIGHYRCIPIPDDGSALPAQTMTDTALMLLSDAAALRRVLTCCTALTDDTRTGQGTLVVQGYNPIRAGDCGGGELLIRVPLERGQVCPP
jgi:hypothetical protein